MIYSYIPDPIPKEEPMGKTVTVEVELPDGYELAEPKARHVKPGEYYLLGGKLQMWPSRSGISATPFPILRPIPAEKTWELPGTKALWLTHDDTLGYVLWCRDKPIFPCNQRYWRPANMALPMPVHSGFFVAPFPQTEGIPPAERIWRIVERGQA